MKNLISSVLISSFLISCGGSDGSSDQGTKQEKSTFVGVFVDSEVMGLNFTTGSQKGTTNINGEFQYQNSETIIFSMGDIIFPEIPATANMTPLSLFSTENINDISVVNTLRLLQTLDVDGDPNNGIEISSVVNELALGLTVDFSSNEFDEQVRELVENSNIYHQQLIPSEQAIAHFEQTLNLGSTANCSSDHELVGYTGDFQTLAHNVSGTATVINDCTIEISNFDYDGGGPEVYIYAAKNHNYDSENAFAISSKINGIVYENKKLTLRLPIERSLDDLDGISVWCVDFNADFGHLKFTAP